MSNGLMRIPQWANGGAAIAVAAAGTATITSVDGATVLYALINNAGAFKVALPDTDSSGNPVQDCTRVVLIVQNATLLNAITDALGNILNMITGVATGAGYTMTYIRNAALSKWQRQGTT